jgi:hypothetical protein
VKLQRLQRAPVPAVLNPQQDDHRGALAQTHRALRRAAPISAVKVARWRLVHACGPMWMAALFSGTVGPGMTRGQAMKPP